MENKDNKYLMDHEYDGIEEYNYPLPFWWSSTFWGGLIFGVGYIIYFIFMNGPSLRNEYYAEKKEMQAKREIFLEKLANFDEGKFSQFQKDQNMVMYGQAIFESNCVACHNQNAAGDIGPNLTDKYWIYTDSTPKGLYSFILEGSPVSGMPAWAGVLSEEELYAVNAYIYSLQGMTHTNPKAKEADGDFYE